MATAYKDYYIYYNGELISSNIDTGLTAVNIYYNDNYVGEGANTLDCDNKYMNGNVIIGNRTLNCSGKYMSGNVQVITQTKYKWQKYNCNSYYTQNTVTNTAGISEWVNVLTGASNAYHGGSYSFNSSNGIYSLTSDIRTPPTKEFSIDASGTRYAMNGTSSNTMVSYTIGYLTPGYNFHWWTNNTVIFMPENHSAENRRYTKYTSSLNYCKGTYITDVISTNSNTYPTNGRHTDGYWYVAV